MRSKKANGKLLWLKEPEAHDYPSAQSYLSLIYNKKKAALAIDELKKASVVWFKAKDVFRASRLSLLGISNHHVKKNMQKINEGKSLSPILLVRDSKNGIVIIADGYHRMCAAYEYDEDTLLPCKIV